MWDRQSGRDLGQSPPKTLGRPTARVKAFCVPFGVPSATESGGDAVMRWGNHTPSESDGTAASTLTADVSTTGLR